MTSKQTAKARAAIIGASGYTGAELVRLLVRHPLVDIVAMTADRKAGTGAGDGVSAPGGGGTRRSGCRA